MSAWFNELWTSFLAWFQGLAARDVASYIGNKLLEGIFQAIAVRVDRLARAVPPVAAAHAREIGPGRFFGESADADRRARGRQAGGGTLLASTSHRSASANGRSASRQCGPAPIDAQPGRAGHSGGSDPGNRKHGRL